MIYLEHVEHRLHTPAPGDCARGPGAAARFPEYRRAVTPDRTAQEFGHALRTAETEKQIQTLTKDIRALELQISELEMRMQPLLLALPNLPHSSYQDRTEHDRNLPIRRWGDPLRFLFSPKPHWELSEKLGLTDFEGGTRLAGSRFVVLKGLGARLERALISFMLDVHTNEHGYTEILPPYLVKRSLMVGAGQLPKFEDQAYV